jgi:hypothetical protein
VVTFGIDTLVFVSQRLHLVHTSTAAKLAEQTAAIGLTFLAGTVVGAVAFALLRVSSEAALLFGGVLGSMWGPWRSLRRRRDAGPDRFRRTRARVDRKGFNLQRCASLYQ